MISTINTCTLGTSMDYDWSLGLHPSTGKFDEYVYVVEKLRRLINPMSTDCPATLVNMLWHKAQVLKGRPSTQSQQG